MHNVDLGACPTDPEGQLVWLSRVDEQLDEIRELIRERIRRRQEYGIESELSRIPERGIDGLVKGKQVRGDVRKTAHRLQRKVMRLRLKVDAILESLGGGIF